MLRFQAKTTWFDSLGFNCILFLPQIQFGALEHWHTPEILVLTQMWKIFDFCHIISQHFPEHL